MPGFDQTTPVNTGRMLGGRYRLIAPIARGGMAEVWEGHDEVLTRPVAVKVLQPHLASDSVFLERFRREAVTAARLVHPGIVATYDTGIDNGTAFIVMELIKGRNLRQLLNDEKRLEPWQAVAITRQVADALAYAHQAGLVHRDVKPANILLVEDKWDALRVKVTDFGIAKAGFEAGADLTQTGIVLGTPKYLSPEQIKGVDPDPRADLYSLGVVLFEMLTGDPPFAADTDMATALAHLNDKIPKASSSARGIPSSLDKLVADLLAKNPDRRVPSAPVLRQRLDALGRLAAPQAGGGAGPPPGWRGRNRRDPSPPYVAVPESAVRSTARPTGHTPTTALTGAPSTQRVTAVDRTALPPPPPPPRPGLRPNGSGIGGKSYGPPPSPFAVPPHPTSPPGNVRSITDEMDAVRHPARRFRRSERTAGMVVLALVVVVVVVTVSLLGSPSHRKSQGASTPPTGSTVKISSVNVFMVDNRTPDNADETELTFDGNPATFWTTDEYANATFGNLYPGIGLEITLASAVTARDLYVTSPTTGWAAEAYVSAVPVAGQQAVTAWGKPTATQTSIDGDTTLNLGGHHGIEYVLLWITNLGPSPHQVSIAELKVN